MTILPKRADFVRPPPLKPASAIRVISPAGAVSENALKAGKEYLETMGYLIKQPKTVTQRYNYFAGTAASRAEELYEAIVRRIKGHDSIIWAARGGYGSSQMAEHGLTAGLLDDLLQELTDNPKWLVGYSDITSISLHIWARARILVLHGPMLVNITEYSPEAIAEMWAILNGSKPLTQVFPGNIRYGKGQGLLAGGRLLGGNLEVIASMLGAKDQLGQPLIPSLNGCILLLEEVNEAPYRIHRALSALLRTPILKSLAGIAFGQLTMPDDYTSQEYGVYDVLHELLEPLGIPIITDVDIGHDTRTARPIVLGAQAEIHGNGVLKVLVPGCL